MGGGDAAAMGRIYGLGAFVGVGEGPQELVGFAHYHFQPCTFTFPSLCGAKGRWWRSRGSGWHVGEQRGPEVRVREVLAVGPVPGRDMFYVDFLRAVIHRRGRPIHPHIRVGGPS